MENDKVIKLLEELVEQSQNNIYLLDGIKSKLDDINRNIDRVNTSLLRISTDNLEGIQNITGGMQSMAGGMVDIEYYIQGIANDVHSIMYR